MLRSSPNEPLLVAWFGWMGAGVLAAALVAPAACSDDDVVRAGSEASGVGGGVDFSTAAVGLAEPPTCDGGIPDAAPGHVAPCDASTAVTYSGDVRPVLLGCTGELCHSPPDYDSLVDRLSTECCEGRLLVAPGGPAESYLLDKLEGRDLCFGSRMPLGDDPLGPDTIQQIADWICAGAPHD
jgi:hypothetical protein